MSKEAILTLKGAIYQNPATWEECFYKGWETAEEYLSGNIKEKIKATGNESAGKVIVLCEEGASVN